MGAEGPEVLAVRRVAVLGGLFALLLASAATAATPRGLALTLPIRWSDSFESGTFLTGGWWFGQGDPTYAHRRVVRAASRGLVAHSGRDVAAFETTPADIAAGRFSAKLYRPFGHLLGTPLSRPPRDVSGTYSAWYFLPRSYHISGEQTVNVFQFKEKYRVPGGDTSAALWWVQLNSVRWSREFGRPVPGRADAPVALLNHDDNHWKTPRPVVAVPLGRWFQITAVVHQGKRIDFTLDGHRLGPARAREHAVSPTHGRRSLEWILGVGNYSQSAHGPLYVDDVSERRG